MRCVVLVNFLLKDSAVPAVLRSRAVVRVACVIGAGIGLAAGLMHPARDSRAQQVPPNFRCEVVLGVPEIEHPSVVTCDERGNLFVGLDPMDMRGPSTEEFDRIVYIVWDDAGQIARQTVFAEGLSAVFGLLWLDEWLYVMHAPHYSRFRDTNGDGVADVREDLAQGFGPPAGVFGFNDHIVSGIRLGIDGWVYVSVGDKGIQQARGADGSSVTLEGGGIVRMRPDGTRLEVVTSGTRNHLDVALDAWDNLFTYDNTDDGLGWWTRFTHQVPGGYYGYPYDYLTRPERHLPHISEHGGGSPCGGEAYLQAAWPAEYRGNVFFCEWGKGKVQRFRLTRQGASFTAEIDDFLVNDGSGELRPADLCFSPDGRYLYVADWNFGGWLNAQQAGRLLRISYTGDDAAPEPPRATDDDPLNAQIDALAHPAQSERLRAQRRLVAAGAEAVAPLTEALAGADQPWARAHAIWAQQSLADALVDYDPADGWIAALADASADVRGQAARALGERRVERAVVALIERLGDEEAGVRLRAAHALGQIGGTEATAAIFAALDEEDVHVRFTMLQALRAMGDWRIAPHWAAGENAAIRAATVLALTGQYQTAAVEALAEIAASAPEVSTRAAALAALAEVDRQADPYTEGWWGTQPARGQPARAKRHEWDGTAVVRTALTAGLAQSAAEVREAAVRAWLVAESSMAVEPFRELAASDPDDRVRLAALEALGALGDEASMSVLVQLAADRATSPALREQAVRTMAAIGSTEAVAELAALVADRDSPPALVMFCLDALATLDAGWAAETIAVRLADHDPTVRARATAAYAAVVSRAAPSSHAETAAASAAADAHSDAAGAEDSPANAAASDERAANERAADMRANAADRIAALLDDPDADVRRAALRALVRLEERRAVGAIIAAASHETTRFDTIGALAALPDARALPLYLEGVVAANQDLREACRRALWAVRADIEADVVALHERQELPAAVRTALGNVLGSPEPLIEWQLAGSWPKDEPPPFDASLPPADAPSIGEGASAREWRSHRTADERGRVDLAPLWSPNTNCWALGYAAIALDAPLTTEALVGSDDQITLWINGTEVYRHEAARGWAADQARVPIELAAGTNHVWVLAGNDGGPWEFSVAVRMPQPQLAFLYESVPEALEPAAYRAYALEHPGDAARGRALFADREGIGCVKCHTVNGTLDAAPLGDPVGPDLRGVGAKYPREELIRSVLEPSNRILSGYELTTVATTTGQVVQGIVRARTEEELQLVDAQGRTLRIAADQIDEIEPSGLSMMPNGLKDGMTLADFADVVAFLVSLQDEPPADRADDNAGDAAGAAAGDAAGDAAGAAATTSVVADAAPENGDLATAAIDANASAVDAAPREVDAADQVDAADAPEHVDEVDTANLDTASAARSEADEGLDFWSGHTEPIYAVSYSPDGRWIASASLDGTVRLWDAARASVVRTLAGADDLVLSVAISPDSRHVAAAGLDRRALVYDFPALDEGSSWSVEVGRRPRVALARDAGRLLVADERAGARGPLLVDLTAGEVVAELTIPADEAARDAATPKLRLAPTSSAADSFVALDGSRKLWGWTADGTVHGELNLPADVLTWAVDPSGRHVATVLDGSALENGTRHNGTLHNNGTLANGTLAIYRWPPPAPARVAHEAPLGPLAFAPDGTWLAVGSEDGSIRICQASDGAAQRSIGHGAAVTAMAATSDGARLAAAGADGRITLANPLDGAVLRQLDARTGAVRALAWLPGDEALATAGDDALVRVWEAPAELPETNDTLELATTPLTALAVDSGGGLAAVATADGRVIVARVDDGSEQASWSLPASGIRTLAFAPSSGAVLAAGSDGVIRMLHIAGGGRLAIEGQPAAVDTLAAHPTAPQVAAAGSDGTIRLWSLADARPLGEWPSASTPVLKLAYTSGGSRVLAVTAGEIVATQVADSAQVYKTELPAVVTAAALSADGERMAVALRDRTVRTYRTEDGSEIASYNLGDEPVTALALAADDRWLAALDADGTIRYFDPATGRLLLVAPLGQRASAVAPLADGRTLTLAGADGKLRLVRLPLYDWFAASTAAVNALAALADPPRLVVASEDGRLLVRELASGGVSHVLAEAGPAPTALAVAAPLARLAAVDRAGGLRAWDLSDGRQVFAVTAPGAAAALAVVTGTSSAAGASEAGQAGSDSGDAGDAGDADDAAQFVVAGDDGVVRRYDARSGALLAAVETQTAPIRGLAIAPDGRTLASAGSDGTLGLDFDPLLHQRSLRGEHVSGMVFASGGSELVTISRHESESAAAGDVADAASANAADGESRGHTPRRAAQFVRWDVASGQPLTRRTAPSAELAHLAASADGRVVAAAGQYDVAVWQLPETILTAHWSLPAVAESVAISADGTRVHVACADGLARTFHSDGREVQAIAHPAGAAIDLFEAADAGALWVTAVDPQGRLVARAWPLDGLLPRLSIAAHDAAVWGVAFSPDSSRLATAGADARVKLWNLADGAAIANSEGHAGPVYQVAFHPDGDELASCGADHSLRRWNAADGAALSTVTAPAADALFRLAYAPDGSRLLTGGQSRTLYRWSSGADAPTSGRIAHGDAVQAIAYNPAGNRVATIDRRGGLHVWDATGQALLFRWQLPVERAHAVAWSPAGSTLAVATSDPRLLIVTLPAAVR